MHCRYCSLASRYCTVLLIYTFYRGFCYCGLMWSVSAFIKLFLRVFGDLIREQILDFWYVCKHVNTSKQGCHWSGLTWSIFRLWENLTSVLKWRTFPGYIYWMGSFAEITRDIRFMEGALLLASKPFWSGCFCNSHFDPVNINYMILEVMI